jgi:ubiquitin conjugation factor E4 B
MVPDLFDLASDSILQLAKALATTATDPTNSVTFDVNGKNTSFYYAVCEELYSQDVEAFERVISEIVGLIAASLTRCETIFDEVTFSDESPLGGNALFLTTALRELCTHKKATIAFTKMKKFLLPAPNTPEASARITPVTPQPPPGATPQQVQLFHMMQRMSNANRSGYTHRSGPGIEKQTILGMVMRQGVPESHPSVNTSFANAATRTKKDVNKSVEGYRRQLENYQNKCNELIKQLLIAGEDARKMVIQWFTDSLLVNVNAGGTRPDRTKVSSTEFLLNVSVILLKLCEPMMNDPKKSLLVDPGFVNSPKDHGGVYDLTGSDHLPRLGENIDTTKEYNPDNKFIPLCFFFCSRALALSIVPESSAFENINYHARRTAWNIQQQNGDVRSDPRLNQILGIQYAREIHMMSPAYITDVFTFYNMAAGVLLRIEKDELKAMPEHIVSDYCTVLDYGAEFTPTLLSGIDFGNIFRLTVTLLSKDYASVSVCA